MLWDVTVYPTERLGSQRLFIPLAKEIYGKKKRYIYEIVYLFTECIVLALENTFSLICVSKYFNASLDHIPARAQFFVKKYMPALTVILCIFEKMQTS